MKKIILSLAVIFSFGIYTFFLRSGDISAELSKLHPVPIELKENESQNTEVSTTSDISNGDTVTRNIDCVYIPSDDDNEEDYYDDEEAEKKGHYKCTTIIVTPPKVTTTTPKNNPIIPTPTTPTANTPPPIIKPKSNSIWKDGTFIGDSVDAYYGNVQVSASISNGKLSQISFLDYPQDRRTSLQKSNHAIPILKSEAISAQNANVNTVSGATYTSEAFIRSLSSALNQAKI